MCYNRPMGAVCVSGVLGVTLLLLLALRILKSVFSKPDRFKSLEGKHVVITGSSRGVGLSLAKKCLEDGAFVTLMARTEEDLRKAAENLVQTIGCPADRILIKTVDVAERPLVTKAIGEAFKWRPIDILICNAGVVTIGFLEDISCEELEKVLRINYLGSVYPVQAALPLMKQRSLTHPSSIIFISSLSSVFLAFASSMYTISKYAQKRFAECLRLELMADNFAVHLVLSGFIDTGIMDTAEKHAATSPFWRKAFLVDRKLALKADEVAGLVIAGVKRGGDLVIHTGKLAFLINVLGRGAYPPESIEKLILELLFTLPLRLLTFLWFLYIRSFHPRV